MNIQDILAVVAKGATWLTDEAAAAGKTVHHYLDHDPLVAQAVQVAVADIEANPVGIAAITLGQAILGVAQAASHLADASAEPITPTPADAALAAHQVPAATVESTGTAS